MSRTPSFPAFLPSLFAAIILPLLFLACEGEELPHPEAQDSPVTASPAAGGGAMTAAPVPTRGPTDPCQIISTEQVRAAANISAEGQPSTSGGAAVCTWTDPAGKSAVVQVYPTPDRYQDSRVAFESLYNRPAEGLAGLGDEAYYIDGRTATVPTATVGARREDTPVTVQIMGVGADPTALRNEAIALTRITLEQL